MISCILPPYMLERIAENGTDEQKAKAADTLRVSAQLRMDRQAAAARAVIPRAVPVPARQRMV